jgi:hypothetical protein
MKKGKAGRNMQHELRDPKTEKGVLSSKAAHCFAAAQHCAPIKATPTPPLGLGTWAWSACVCGVFFASAPALSTARATGCPYRSCRASVSKRPLRTRQTGLRQIFKPTFFLRFRPEARAPYLGLRHMREEGSVGLPSGLL